MSTMSKKEQWIQDRSEYIAIGLSMRIAQGRRLSEEGLRYLVARCLDEGYQHALAERGENL